MTILKKITYTTLAAMSMAMIAPAMAEQINVSKLRVNLQEGQQSDFLTVRNESATEKQAFEVTLQKWEQTSNIEEYSKNLDKAKPDQLRLPQEILIDTKDILVSPKTIVVGPKQEKVIRIIVNDLPAAKKNYSYRLVINQLPSKEVDTKENNVIRFLFKVTLPILVHSGPIKTADKMSIDYKYVNTGEYAYVDISNKDNQHIQLQNIAYKNEETPMNVYILPNMTQRFPLSKGVDVSQPITFTTDKGKVTVNLKK